MKIEFDHTIFIYDESDKDLIFDLNNYIDQNYNDIINFFNIEEVKEKVIIEIVPTKILFDEKVKEYKDIYKKNGVPDWVVGFFTGAGSNKILYLSIKDYINTAHKNNIDLLAYKKTVLREYVHYITSLVLEKEPLKALSEGIAQYLSHQRDNIKISFNYELNDILNSNESYFAWYLVTKYIIDNNSKEYFLELLCDKEKAIKFITLNFNDIKNSYSKENNKKNI